jgi:hypothetical protein
MTLLASAVCHAATLPTALLSTAGIVWTNGVALPSGSSVRAGDTVATGSGGFAVIRSSWSKRVEVRGNSNVTLQSDGLTLQSGVVASEYLPVRHKEHRFAMKTPGGGSLLVVAIRDGQPVVGAHGGDVLITSAGGAPVLVPAGHYALPSVPNKNQENGEESTRKRTPPAGQTSQPGWTIGPLSHGASVALVVSAVAGGVAFSTAALLGDSPSPSQ